MKRSSADNSERRLSLRVAESPRDAWDCLLRDWLARAVERAWERRLPTVVVLPTYGEVTAVKSRLLDDGCSYLGLRFLTPAGLREFLSPGPVRLRAEPEHLRLLLAVAAEDVASRDRDNPAVQAIVRAPHGLLSTLERLAAAGWDFAQLPFPSLQPVVRRFGEYLGACGFGLNAEQDRSTAEHARTTAPVISRLLISGFDGAHWPLWFLLQAAVHAAQETTVLLRDRRDEACELDEAWIGTWEQHYGAAEPVGTPPAWSETLFPDLFERNDSASEPATARYFLVGRTVTDQAKAIVALVENFLASGSAERIAVVFPATGALPRAVAALLGEANIPHYDAIGHLAPGPLEDAAWPAWLDLQENPRLRVLLRFLRASPPTCRLYFPDLHLDQVEDVLRRSARNLLLDDLLVLRGCCATRARSDVSEPIVAGLDAIRFLPERATLTEFLDATLAIFEQLGWTERAAHLAHAATGWPAHVAVPFSRAVYLRWLSEVSNSVLPERASCGAHPYSRVHLLFPAQAENQSWSHLIFAGLNEGAWPARAEQSGFLDDHDIAAFNTGIRKLNRRVTRQGAQGEGHTVVAEGKTFCLGPAEQRAIAERQFQTLCESVSVAVAAAISLVEESAPERFANPGEFFTRLYLEAHGEPPGQATLGALAERTAEWVGSAKVAPATKAANKDIAQTALAYRARHTPDVPFGEYEFALRKPLPKPRVLAATECERIIKAPALLWLKMFLGVEARDDELANWNLAIGQWVHDWLRQVAPSGGEFVERPRRTDLRARVQQAARSFRDDVRALFGRALPDWWNSAWRQAAFIADALATTLEGTEEWSHFATEWTLPPATVPLAQSDELRVRGRVDLVLAREPSDGKDFPFREAWVIDYKTGRRASLAPGRKAVGKASEDFRTKLLDGKGVQLAIYALGLNALGADDVGISLLTRDLELDKPQVALPAILAQENIWRDLAQISRSGVFGMRGPLRAEFQFQNDYPLATLGFDPDFLEEKWTRTHPELPKIEKRP